MSTESLRHAIEDTDAADKAEATRLAEKQVPAEKDAVAELPREKGLKNRAGVRQ